MHLKNICAAGFAALGLSAVVSAQSAAVGATQTRTDDKEITLVGCVVKGDGGYVLSGIGPGFTIETTRTTVGTSGTTTTTTTTTSTPGSPIVPPPDRRVIYWLDDDDDLEEHVGRRVEVRGEIEGDIEAGEIEIERENGLIELEIKAKGEKITVKLPDTPAAVGTSGTVTDRPQDIPFFVRKLDVESVKRLADSCS